MVRTLVSIGALVVFAVPACSGGVAGVAADGGTPSDGGTGNDGAAPPPGSPPQFHRPAPTACSKDRLPGLNPDGGAADAGPYQCTSDVQCTAGTNGRCTTSGRIGPQCSYDQCFADSDCPANTVCECGASTTGGRAGANTCLKGNCRVDSDCGAGGYCSPSAAESCANMSGTVGYYCHTASDTCKNDSDCNDAGPNGGGPGFCTYHSESGAWACSYGFCAG
jgi:hypothetical protein